MTMFTRSLVALVAVVFFATPALAGPPLICNPFDTGGGKLIAWGSGPGWNTPSPGYDIKKLVADTTAVLSPDATVIVRMENMRRATIYAMRDPQIAQELLKTVMDRALATTSNSMAWFDAGYLVESYKQAKAIREIRNPEQRAWTAVDETIKVDGYNWVKKAMSMTAPSAEMEFAASLMTEGPVSTAHRARALSAAAPKSLLASNLSKVQ